MSAKKDDVIRPSPKTVRFSEGTVFNGDKTIDPKKISRTEIMRLLRLKQYGDLTSYLKLRIKLQYAFFSTDKGANVVRYALNSDLDKLEFLVDNIGANYIRNALLLNDKDVLVDWFYRYLSLERRNELNAERRKFRIEKFKLLLKIYSELKEFVLDGQKNNKDYITKSVLEDFGNATTAAVPTVSQTPRV